jgi:N4-gp56 family major capsid protein
MAYTQVSSLNSVGTAAYDRLMYFALRAEKYFDAVATVKPTRQTHVGGSVKFHITSDLATATTPLTETADPDAVALSDSAVTVTLVEYGNVVSTTAKARGTALLELDTMAANAIGENAGATMDEIARDELIGGTNVLYGGDATQTSELVAGDILTSAMIRQAVAKLRGANVKTFGGNYRLFIHPDQSYDLRAETGVSGWTTPANHSDAMRIWNGYVGTYLGCDVIEASTVNIDTDAGDSSVDAYDAVVVGQECLAKAHSIVDGNREDPQFVVGPVADKLARFRHIGWKHLVGYERFREAAIYRLETASSIGANS